MRFKKRYDPERGADEQIFELRGIDPFTAEIMKNGTEGTRRLLSDKQATLLYSYLNWYTKGEGLDRIFVFADYDADGVTSAAIANLYLNCEVWIPERSQGYGLTAESVNSVPKGIGTVLTVDCGIQSKDAVEILRDHGAQVIITDHHEINEANLPDADIIIHPTLSSFHGYSGSGTIYKALSEVYGDNEEALQLATIGTICDVMPLVDENRRLVRAGLDSIRRDPSIGIEALCKAAGVNCRYITEEDIGFYIGPLLNACGRMGDARCAYDLLTASNEDYANDLAARAKSYNESRKALTKGFTDKADSCIVLRGPVNVYVYDELPTGIVGLVANSVAKDNGVAAVVLYRDGERYTGSCRSGGAFSCSDVLDSTREFLESGGGHKGAAGLSLKRENLRPFLDAVSELSESRLYKEAEYSADFSIDFSYITDIMRDVLSLRPYGNGFEAPSFVSPIREYEVVPFGTKKNHTRIKVGDVDLMMFYQYAEDVKKIADGEPIRAAYRIGSTYNVYTKKPTMIVERIEKI